MSSELAKNGRARVPKIAPPSRKHLAAKTVGQFVPRITRKAFQKFGFASADLISGWPTIVGGQVASFAVPERLKWPRRDCAITGESKARSGATLVLRVEGSRALELQYRGQDIIERINGYFGYGAVRELRFVQGPVSSPDSRVGSEAAAPRQQGSLLQGSPPELCALPAGWGEDVADQGLRAALARLAARVQAV